MTRTAVLSFAAAIGFAATLTAQSTTSTTTQQRDRMNGDKHEVTITGCLSKGADGNYMLTNASEDKAGSTTTASGATTTGTTGTTAANEPKNGMHSMTWKLEGGSDLDKHVGHKIQVTGRTDWKDSMDRRPGDDTNPPTTTSGTTGSGTTTGTSTTGTTASGSESQRRSATTTDANQPKLDVTSVKMISSSCS